MKAFAQVTLLLAGFGIAIGGALVIHPKVARGAQETYRLATIEGAPLPMLVEQDEGCSEEVLSATLTLHGDGRWVLASTERETCGENVREEQDEDSGRYTREGQTLRFEDDDDGDAEDDDADEIDIDDLDEGSLAGNVLSVRLESGRKLVFER